MKKIRIIAVTLSVSMLAALAGYASAQRMEREPMKPPAAQQRTSEAESGKDPHQHAPENKTERGQQSGMGAGGLYGTEHRHGMGPGMMGLGMMGGGMMGSMMGQGMGMMGPMGMGGGFGPGMGMMGPMMSSMMQSPQMMGLMMSMHGDMISLMGRMMQRYGGEQSPEAQEKMRTEMLREMGDILVKHGNRMKETAKTSSR